MTQTNTLGGISKHDAVFLWFCDVSWSGQNFKITEINPEGCI